MNFKKMIMKNVGLKIILLLIVAVFITSCSILKTIIKWNKDF